MVWTLNSPWLSYLLQFELLTVGIRNLFCEKKPSLSQIRPYACKFTAYWHLHIPKTSSIHCCVHTAFVDWLVKYFLYVSLVHKYHSSFFANMWLLSSLLLELCWCISVWFPWYYLKKYSSRSVSYSKLCTWALRWGSSINSSLCCSNLLSLVYTSITWMLVAQETIMDIVVSVSW